MLLKRSNGFSRVLLTSVAALIATTSLHAIPRDPCECPPQPVCCAEPAPGPFAFSYPYDMDLQCPRDFYVHLDGLAFQAKQEGLEYGIQSSSAPAAGQAITQGKVRGFSDDDSSWDYNPGARFGVGFYLDHDAWNVDFNWTWCHVSNYNHANATSANASPGIGVIIPLWVLGLGSPAGSVGGRSSSSWKANYNVFDLSLAKPFHVSRYLVVNPFFGLRGASITQQYSADYGGTTTLSGNPIVTRVIHHIENDFWGVGARAGVCTDWLIGKGWALFGNIAASMLVGNFSVDQRLQLPGSGNQDGLDVDDEFNQNVPNMEIILGIGWGEYFSKKQYHVGIRAAYEFHQWWDQFNARKFWSGSAGVIQTPAVATTGIYANDRVSRGDLSLNGFSLRLQFDM